MAVRQGLTVLALWFQSHGFKCLPLPITFPLLLMSFPSDLYRSLPPGPEVIKAAVARVPHPGPRPQ